MITIFTGYHLETIKNKVPLYISQYDTLEETVTKVTKLLDDFKAFHNNNITIATNNVIVMDTITTLAMEHHQLDNVVFFYKDKDYVIHKMTFDDTGQLNSHYNYKRIQLDLHNRFYKAYYAQLRETK
jgi:hypothetical protein